MNDRVLMHSPPSQQRIHYKAIQLINYIRSSHSKGKITCGQANATSASVLEFRSNSFGYFDQEKAFLDDDDNKYFFSVTYPIFRLKQKH